MQQYLHTAPRSQLRVMQIARKQVREIGEIIFKETARENRIGRVAIISGSTRKNRKEKGIALLFKVNNATERILKRDIATWDYADHDTVSAHIDHVITVGYIDMLRHIVRQDCTFIIDLDDWITAHNYMQVESEPTRGTTADNYMQVENELSRCIFLCPPQDSPSAPKSMKGAFTVWSTQQADELLKIYNGVTTFVRMECERDRSSESGRKEGGD